MPKVWDSSTEMTPSLPTTSMASAILVARAAFTDFTPFYEFVSGPLCAGGFGPNALDGTFGPQVVFQKVPPPGRFDLSPLEGSCHFGHVKIDGKSGVMTVSHRDAGGAVIHSLDVAPS